ncbi:MAG: alpha/beta fold hydrolase [Tepidisphaeraceae bacterium]
MPTANLNGFSMNYLEQGQGRSIVLLHGFPLDAGVFDDQVQALSDRFRVIAPDLRGFGGSTSDAPFTIESLADDLHQLLSRIGALPCVLGGLSMGGYVALAFAEKYPRDVAGLVLIDTRSEADSSEGKQKRNAMVELVRERGARAIADQMLPNLLAAPVAPDRLLRMMSAVPAATIQNALRAMRDRKDYTSLLSSLKLPTLIVVGEKDAITPPALARAMHQAIAGSRLLIIQGAGHLTPMESPEDLSNAIREFVSGIPTRSAL